MPYTESLKSQGSVYKMKKNRTLDLVRWTLTSSVDDSSLGCEAVFRS